jgi:hypothetical protein
MSAVSSPPPACTGEHVCASKVKLGVAIRASKAACAATRTLAALCRAGADRRQGSVAVLHASLAAP